MTYLKNSSFYDSITIPDRLIFFHKTYCLCFGNQFYSFAVYTSHDCEYSQFWLWILWWILHNLFERNVDALTSFQAVIPRSSPRDSKVLYPRSPSLAFDNRNKATAALQRGMCVCVPDDQSRDARCRVIFSWSEKIPSILFSVFSPIDSKQSSQTPCSTQNPT